MSNILHAFCDTTPSEANGKPTPAVTPSQHELESFLERYHRAMQDRGHDASRQMAVEQTYGATALAMLELLAKAPCPAAAPTEASTSMTATAFQAWVEGNWGRLKIASQDPLADLFVICTGASGEVGEALEIVKKSIRDGFAIEGKHREQFLLEMGDALHYLTRLASYYGLTLGEIMSANRQKIDARAARREARAASLGACTNLRNVTP